MSEVPLGGEGSGLLARVGQLGCPLLQSLLVLQRAHLPGRGWGLLGLQIYMYVCIYVYMYI